MLGDLIGDVAQNGLWQGGMNYFGNNIPLGRDINEANKALGGKGQLIGNPEQTQPTGNNISNLTDEHLNPADKNGIRTFTDQGKQFLQGGTGGSKSSGTIGNILKLAAFL